MFANLHEFYLLRRILFTRDLFRRDFCLLPLPDRFAIERVVRSDDAAFFPERVVRDLLSASFLLASSSLFMRSRIGFV